MNGLLQRALRFAAGALALYLALYGASEWLVHRNGHANAMYKIARAAPAYDWVVLGASHAMPLDFEGVNAALEARSGQRILNLAAQGTGPLYQRFALEEFLRAHRARRVMYVADGFAFHSAQWNEERFADVKLLRRTPMSLDTAAHLWDYVRREGVDWRAWLDYATGFSKINNRERCERDAWDGEATFERVYRPSSSATAKRIEYLYPDGADPARLARYLRAFDQLLDTAARNGIEVTVVRMPVPPAFQRKLPDEEAFAAALEQSLAARGVRLLDFTNDLPDAKLYSDTDHLNRAGVERFAAILAPVLAASAEPPAR